MTQREGTVQECGSLDITPGHVHHRARGLILPRLCSLSKKWNLNFNIYLILMLPTQTVLSFLGLFFIIRVVQTVSNKLLKKLIAKLTNKGHFKRPIKQKRRVQKGSGLMISSLCLNTTF